MDNETVFQFVCYEAIHKLRVIPKEEGTERIPSLERVHLRPIQVPRNLGSKCGNKLISRSLRIEMRAPELS